MRQIPLPLRWYSPLPRPSRFGQVKTDEKLIVLIKKTETKSKQELPHTVSAQQAGGVELEQPQTGAQPLDDVAILERQAAALQRAIDQVCESQLTTRQANSPANAAANFSANQEFAPGSRGSQANHGPVGSQGGSQTKVAGSEGATPSQTPSSSQMMKVESLGSDPSFSMESEDHDSGVSSDESEGGGEEPLFPHPPVFGESHESGTSHRVPQNQEPGDNTGTSPAKAEEDSQEYQHSQQHDTSSEVDLLLPPARSLALMLNKKGNRS